VIAAFVDGHGQRGRTNPLVVLVRVLAEDGPVACSTLRDRKLFAREAPPATKRRARDTAPLGTDAASDAPLDPGER
jgi:hypothetical protein